MKFDRKRYFFLILDRFDIHVNKIIRTDESINMGAKFIADVELMSHDQCLRLCCETEGCNVFVYEEKVRNISKDDDDCEVRTGM